MGSQMFSDVPMIFSGCSQMFSGYLKDTAGGSSRMITVLHRGGPANDYGIT